MLPVDAILFSGRRDNVDDAVRHLADHKKLYWEVSFLIDKGKCSFPMYGFIHVKGERVEYRATIRDILPFSPAHYKDPQVKPEAWRREWKARAHGRNALVITEIVPFSYNTLSLTKKKDGTKVQAAPQGNSYVSVLPPDTQFAPTEKKVTLAERNLEDFIVQQLEAIEPGLHLVERQLRTLAGRLDLLCKDANGHYVVVELKRMQGSDQVVGQILRYMGWVRETHHVKKVRGIIVVPVGKKDQGKKDQALAFAVMAAPNIQVKKFKFQFQID
jgi:RecB family endonuclease NucS